METERMALSQRERDRLRVLHEVKQGHVSQVEAAPTTFRLPIIYPRRKSWKRTILNCKKPDISTLR
jgi:hypothetical protein